MAEAALAPRLQVQNVSVDYHGVVALHGASLVLPAGSICGLVGMNGAGKSTLFKALMGFVKPSSGHIRINGRSVREAQRHQRWPTSPRARWWTGISR